MAILNIPTDWNAGSSGTTCFANTNTSIDLGRTTAEFRAGFRFLTSSFDATNGYISKIELSLNVLSVITTATAVNFAPYGASSGATDPSGQVCATFRANCSGDVIYGSPYRYVSGGLPSVGIKTFDLGNSAITHFSGIKASANFFKYTVGVSQAVSTNNRSARIEALDNVGSNPPTLILTIANYKASGACDITTSALTSPNGVMTLGGTTAITGSGAVGSLGGLSIGADSDLIGSGVVDSTATLTFNGSSAIISSGVVSPNAVMTVAGFSSIVGSGATTANSVVTYNGQSSINGSGVVSSLGGLTLVGTGAISTSALTTSAGVLTLGGVATILGSGFTTANGVLTLGGISAITGSGAVSSTANITYAGASSLTCSGATTANGNLLLGGICSIGASAVVSPTANCTYGAFCNIPASATVFVSGTVTAQSGGDVFGQADIVTSALVNASSAVTRPAFCSINGSGVLNSLAGLIYNCSSAIAGAATTTVSSSVILPGSTAITSSGVVSASASLFRGGVCAIAGSAVTSLAGVLTQDASASIATQATVGATGKNLFNCQSDIAAAVTLGALGGRVLSAISNINVNSNATVDGSIVGAALQGVVNITASGAVWADAIKLVAGACDINASLQAACSAVCIYNNSLDLGVEAEVNPEAIVDLDPVRRIFNVNTLGVPIYYYATQKTFGFPGSAISEYTDTIYEVTIFITKPSGSRISWPAASWQDAQAIHLTHANDLDEAGIYSTYCLIKTAQGEYYTDTSFFQVIGSRS